LTTHARAAPFPSLSGRETAWSEDTVTSKVESCTKCGASTEGEESREYLGEVLCEDCYLDALSPVKTCDPWAVHTARSLKDLPGGLTLTPRQQQLYDLVKEQGEVAKQEAARILGVSEDELQREFAVLRHLEMLRACKKDEGIFLIPF
jgi:hypothetical protein